MIPVAWDKDAQDRHEAWAFQIAMAFDLPTARAYLLDIETAQIRIAQFSMSGVDFNSPGHPHLKRIITPSGYSVFYELDSVDRPTSAIIISVIRGQEDQP